MGVDGEKWGQCIDIKKDTTVSNVSINAEGDEISCEQLTNILKESIINVRARFRISS